MKPVVGVAPRTYRLADAAGTADAVPEAAALVVIEVPSPHSPDHLPGDSARRAGLSAYQALLTEILESKAHMPLYLQGHVGGHRPRAEIAAELLGYHVDAAALLTDTRIHKSGGHQVGRVVGRQGPGRPSQRADKWATVTEMRDPLE